MRLHLILILVLLFTVPATSQELNQWWETNYGGQYRDQGGAIIPAHEGGYIVASTKCLTDDLNGPSNIVVTKIDDDGEVEWQQEYGSQRFLESYPHIIATSDGGYILLFRRDELDDTGASSRLLKIDGEGGIAWGKGLEFGDEYESVPIGQGVIQTADGGYMISAAVSEIGDDTRLTWDLHLMRLDSIGDSLWFRQYGKEESVEWGRVYLEYENGDFLIAGEISAEDEATNIWIFKVDAEGDSLWSVDYGGEGAQYPFRCMPIHDGGYVVAGVSTSEDYSHSASDFLVLKVDENDDLAWMSTFGNNMSDMACDVASFGEDTYLVVGFKNDAGLSTRAFGIIIDDENGEAIDTVDFTNRVNFLFRVTNSQRDEHQDFMLTGGTLSGEFGMQTWVVKLSTDPNTAPEYRIEIPLRHNMISAYPNPFNSTTTIHYSLIRNDEVSLSIVDLVGRTLMSWDKVPSTPGSHTVSWDASDLPGGEYFVRLETLEAIKVHKVVLVK